MLYSQVSMLKPMCSTLAFTRAFNGLYGTLAMCMANREPINAPNLFTRVFWMNPLTYLNWGYVGDRLISKVPKITPMGKKDLEIKSPVDVSEIEIQYDQYISIKKSGKPNKLLFVLALLILFSGGFIAHDILKESECMFVDDYDDSNSLGCGGVIVGVGDFVLVPTLILLSIPLIIWERQLTKSRYAARHRLKTLAKLSQFPSDLADLKNGREERILSHVESMLNQNDENI